MSETTYLSIIYSTVFKQILGHADSSSEGCVGKGSSTIHYPDSMSPIEISVIGALLVGTPNLRLGGGIELLQLNSKEGANCSISLCTCSAVGAVTVHADKDQEGPISLHPLSLSDYRSNSSSAGGKCSMETLRPHSYFKGVPWGKLLDSPVPASFRPSSDTANEARGDYGLYEDFNFPQTSKPLRDIVQEPLKAAINYTS